MDLKGIIKDFLIKHPTHDIKSDTDRIRMLQLYNVAYPKNMEYNRNCSHCRARLHSGLVKYINENG